MALLMPTFVEIHIMLDRHEYLNMGDKIALEDQNSTEAAVS